MILAISLALLAAPSAFAFTAGPGALEVPRAVPATRQLAGDGSQRLGAKLDEASVDAAARAIVDSDPAFFLVDSRELKRLSVRTFSDGRTYAQYRQTWHGIEVVDSFVDLEFAHGRLVLANAVTWPASSFATLVPKAAIIPADADAIATHAIAARARVERIELPSEAVVVPTDHGMRLAFRNVVRAREPIGRWETLVAADGSGEVLGRRDRIAWDVAQLTIEAEPRHIGDTPVAMPAKGITIAGAHADQDGIFPSTAGSATVTVSGAWFDITNQSATRKSTTLNVQGGSALESLNWAFADGTPEELDAFTYANQAREHEMAIAPDLSYFRSQFPVIVDEGGVCNAFYDGQALNFFPLGSSGGTTCNNTARIADVIYHEYGHSIHDNLTNRQGFDSQIQEGVADIFAHTITEDPNLGPYFFPNDPTGIRNADEVRTYPTGVQGNDAEVHESGKIWTNTWWNVRKTFVAKYGEAIGRRKFDVLHSTTLRSNPGYTSAYMDALAADDDDGDLSNGTPDSCEMNPIFQAHGLIMNGQQPVRGYLALTHTPPSGDQAAGSAIPVSVTIESLSPTCGDLDPSSPTLHYLVDGGGEQTASLSAGSVAGTFQGAIPGQKDGSVVSYWITAKESAHGAMFGAPAGAPGTSAGLGSATNVYRVHVGSLTNVFFDDFESGAPGWTHGADIAAHDDWEIGTPGGAAIAIDPTAAFSGTRAAGNDLGLRGGNGLYEGNVDTWLDSPTIDCSKCQGARLQFRRWLSVEGSPSDLATVSVNGTVVWTNEAQTRSDLGWDFEDLDISSLADGNGAVKVRFELKTDGGLEMGGWTLDDVAIRAESGGVSGTPPSPGSAGLNTLRGGCMCSTTASTPAELPLASLFVTLLAGAAIAARRRRSAA